MTVYKLAICTGYSHVILYKCFKFEKTKQKTFIPWNWPSNKVALIISCTYLGAFSPAGHFGEGGLEWRFELRISIFHEIKGEREPNSCWMQERRRHRLVLSQRRRPLWIEETKTFELCRFNRLESVQTRRFGYSPWQRMGKNDATNHRWLCFHSFFFMFHLLVRVGTVILEYTKKRRRRVQSFSHAKISRLDHECRVDIGESDRRWVRKWRSWDSGNRRRRRNQPSRQTIRIRRMGSGTYIQKKGGEKAMKHLITTFISFLAKNCPTGLKWNERTKYLAFSNYDSGRIKVISLVLKRWREKNVYT